MKIILGSSSPRRKELLSILCNNFTTYSPHIDETPLVNESPYNYCTRISMEKNQQIYHQIQDESLIITADTIVTHDNKIYGKPDTYSTAITMLENLSGKTHTVATSTTVTFNTKYKVLKRTFISKTEVTFKQLDKNIIQKYLSSIHYNDKAGSYAIQNNSEFIIKSINGSLSNVVGLPIGDFINCLNKMNLFDFFFNFYTIKV